MPLKPEKLLIFQVRKLEKYVKGKVIPLVGINGNMEVIYMNIKIIFLDVD